MKMRCKNENFKNNIILPTCWQVFQLFVKFINKMIQSYVLKFEILKKYDFSTKIEVVKNIIFMSF